MFNCVWNYSKKLESHWASRYPHLLRVWKKLASLASLSASLSRPADAFTSISLWYLWSAWGVQAIPNRWIRESRFTASRKGQSIPLAIICPRASQSIFLSTQFLFGCTQVWNVVKSWTRLRSRFCMYCCSQFFSEHSVFRCFVIPVSFWPLVHPCVGLRFCLKGAQLAPLKRSSKSEAPQIWGSAVKGIDNRKFHHAMSHYGGFHRHGGTPRPSKAIQGLDDV